MRIYYHNDLEKSMVIYKIKNLINKKIYVGQTTGKLKWRIRSSLYNVFLKRAMRKYGKENFGLSVIQNCTSIRELNEREQFWISFYDSTHNQKGYNLQSGGKNCRTHESTKRILSEKCSGWRHTERAKEKISESQQGDKHWAYGKKFSKKHIENMSKGHLGNKHNQATKDRLRQINKGRVITWGNKISESKCKITEKQILGFITKNPYAAVRDIMKHFKLRSNGPVYRLGGLRQLRQKALGAAKILCPLCKKSFKTLSNTHLQYRHNLRTREERRENLLSFGS